VHQQRNFGCGHYQFAHQFQSFWPERRGAHRYGRGVAARPIEARNEAEFDWITSRRQDDWRRRDRGPDGTYVDVETAGEDHSHLAGDEIGRQRLQPIKLTFGPTEFDRHIAARDITVFIEPLAERRHQMRVRGQRPAAEESDHRHRRLLRLRHERPRNCRAAK
jgi:hypothetical protein